MDRAVSDDLAELKLTLRRLSDRQAILDCLTRYLRAVDRMDRPLLQSSYHDNAWNDREIFCGPATTFIDWVEEYHVKHQTLHHHITNHSCDLDGDTAHTETYYLFAGVNRVRPAITLSDARYIDLFERRGKRWAIAARKCLIEWTGTMDALLLSPEQLALMTGKGISMRDTRDASYDRPLTLTRNAELAEFW